MAVLVQLAEFVLGLVERFGLLGIFVAMVIEGIFTPLPSPLFLPFAGLLAREGSLSLPLVILVATVGATLGSLGAYTISRVLGRPFLLRYGRYFGIQERHLDRVDGWFRRYGSWAVLAGNAVTGVRSVIAFPAGIARMPLRRFIPFTMAGALIWTTLLVLVGYYLGQAAFDLANRIGSLDYWVLGGLAVGLLSFILYRRWRRGQRAAQAVDP